MIHDSIILGTSFSRWTKSSWEWLHTCHTISPHLLHALAPILPCTICSIHMSDYLLLHEPETSVWSMSEYIFQLHNVIRQRQDKPLLFQSLEMIGNHYEHVDSLASFRQFTYAVACVCELDEEKSISFQRFFSEGCKIMGLDIPVYESGERTCNWFYFVYLHFQTHEEVSYEALLIDFLPSPFHDRFRTPIFPVVSEKHSYTRIWNIVLLLLLFPVVIIIGRWVYSKTIYK
jgi:hypothetical protein